MVTCVKNLRVNNLGPFDDLFVEFSDDTNIIIGANASGKTSLLKGLCYSFSPRGLEYTRLRKGAGFRVEAQNSEHSFSIGMHDIVQVDQDYRRFSAGNWSRPVDNDVEVNLASTESNSYNLLAIGANRFFDYQRINGMEREMGGQEKKDFYKNNNIDFLDKAKIPNIKQWMINRYFVVDKPWAVNERMNWNNIIDLLPKVGPHSTVIEFVSIGRDLEIKFRVNNKECYLEELSSGFKSFVSIVFSIIDWCEGVNDFERALIDNCLGTVLIDEIDAHLHPEWQMTILSSLRKIFPKLQFIVTTHSPLVLASAEKNQVIRIPQHNGVLNLKPADRDYKAWDVNYILEDLMGAINVEELNSKNLLGPIDEAFKSLNINLYEQELDKLRQIMNANDPLLKLYEIKRGSLILKMKNDIS